MLRPTLVSAAVAAMLAAPVAASIGTVAATLGYYEIQTPDIASCRLKGVDTSSENFNLYASVSGKDVSMNEGCARCIKVSTDSGASVTAYVLDVCQGCKSGELKLSKNALSQIGLDQNVNGATASYKFVNCPSTFLSGNVKACLMEGASNSYIPLQFMNSQKVIKTVTINSIPATQNKDAFFYYASPQESKEKASAWFKDVEVSLTSTDDETKTGTFSFGGTSGCATSTFQFSAASTADGAGDRDGGSSGKSGSGGSSIVLPAVLGGVGALILIVASVFFIRRRRAANDAQTPDVENQYLSPTTKHRQSPQRPTYAMEGSHNNSDDPTDNEPNSPDVDFNEASTPAASAAPARAPAPAPAPVPAPVSVARAEPKERFNSPTTQTAPEPARASQPTSMSFSYSKPETTARASATISARSSTRAAPTFNAPVIPATSFAASKESSGDRRSSFDIDDLRQTEMKQDERFSSFNDVAPYSSESAYASGQVTSPQSYVRATTLRRASSKVTRDTSLRLTSTPAPQPSFSMDSDDFSRDSYASDFQAQFDPASSGAAFADNSITSSSGDFDPSASHGTFRESSGSGYSRESLGILGYPYARKPSERRSNAPGALTGTNP
ncbi:hypothetical protein ATCC90586_009585 [Pythium insidiosum]|nr:hypothetical protein ATCC90586_009585 [Pythium insidiosum]